MATKAKQQQQGRVGVILDGIKKLYNVNPKLSWLLIIVSLLGSIDSYTSKNNQITFNDVSGSSTSLTSLETFLLVMIFMIPLFILGFLAFVFIDGMVAYSAWKATKNEKPSISEAFQATKEKFWVLAHVAILVFFRVLGGLLLLVVPGIRAICRYYVSAFVVFDKNLSAQETIKYSKNLTKDNLLPSFIIIVASGILMPISYMIQYGGLVGIYPWLKKNNKVAKG